MKLLSDFKKDVRTVKTKPGGYEWWYFDGIDTQGKYRFVVIFYEGNPFSNRYIRRIENRHKARENIAEDHPAVSISVYRNDNPIYYSFTEFEKSACSFNEEQPELSIGEHHMQGKRVDGNLVYTLTLNEELPSGDRLEGKMQFSSPEPAHDLLDSPGGEEAEGHFWNLVQPRSRMSVRLWLNSRGEEAQLIETTGYGYHDHNTGEEPMRNEFKDWYWGRFHFDIGTLIFYIMHRKNDRQQRGWLIRPDNGSVIQVFDNITIEDKGLNLFGLNSARRLLLSNDEAHVSVQQSTTLDNGPFYQRFDSDAFLNLPKDDFLQAAHGITEFIRPDRIYWKVFWPLVNMRIWYRNESPHWVQQSKILYRWTW